MKAFKKHIFLFILILIGTYFGGIKGVEAANLEKDDYNVQCIYNDSGQYSSSWNKSLNDNNGGWVFNRNTYNLSETDNTATTATSMQTYVTASFKPVGTYYSCYEWLGSTTYSYEANDETVNVSYYKFGDSKSAAKFAETDFTEEASKGWWKKLWGIPTASAEAALNNQVQYNLVSETIVLDGDAPDPKVSLFFVKKAVQAAGTNQYIELMVYDNLVVIKNGDRTSILPDGYSAFGNATRDSNTGKISGVSDAYKVIYLNTPEPIARKNDNGGVYYSFKENHIRYTFSTTNNGFNTSRYELTDEIPATGDLDSGALCTEIMPETAVVLKEIIKYAQLLVPVFLIILTAIDIGKIVVSGNIEEDLPKQKKRITIRFVVAAFFFFIPLIVNLVLGFVVTSGEEKSSTIELIGCLFEN